MPVDSFLSRLLTYSSLMSLPGVRCARVLTLGTNVVGIHSAFAAILMPLSLLWNNASAPQVCRPRKKKRIRSSR